MEFLRKIKLDADLPTKTKKGEEEAEVGERKGKVIGHVGRRRGRGGKKRKGGVGWRTERNHPCVPPGLPCKSAGTSALVSWMPPHSICCQPRSFSPSPNSLDILVSFPFLRPGLIPLIPRCFLTQSIPLVWNALPSLHYHPIYPASLTLSPASLSQGSHSWTSLALPPIPSGPESPMLHSHILLPQWHHISADNKLFWKMWTPPTGVFLVAQW